VLLWWWCWSTGCSQARHKQLGSTGHVAPYCGLGWGRGTATPEIPRSVTPVLSVRVAAYSWAADRAQSPQAWVVFGSALHPPRLYEEAGWTLRDTGDTVARCLQTLLEHTLG